MSLVAYQLSKMAAVFRISSKSVFKRLLQPVILNTRAISTSKKNSDTVTNAECVEPASASTGKNWVSYGFYTKDETADRQTTHSVFFGAITLCMVIGGFVWSYMPDYQMRDWAQREAYLEVRRREKLGLPHISADLVDPKCFKLPSDSEIGDMEIII